MASIDSASGMPEQPTTVREAAEQYTGRGWAITPLIADTKAARLPAWTTTDVPFAEFDRQFEPRDGIGIRTGEPSGWLVDVDLDSALALRVARHAGMLPKTGLVAGRDAKPWSHWLYLVEGELPHKTFKGSAVPGPIVEILSSGQQMAAPPGRVADGEQKVWYAYGEPARIKAEDLRQCVAEVAVVAELLAIWPRQGDGLRHAAYLALAGGLLNAGVDQDRIEAMTEVLIAETGDHEPDDRRRAVASTLEKEDGGPMTGWPTLSELTGAKASIEAILGWLGVGHVDLDDTRPAVMVYEGDLDKLSARAWTALAEANDPPTLFRRSNKPVRVERIDDSNTVIIRDLDDTLLRHHADDAIRWWTRNRKGEEVATKPPIDVIRDMRANPNIPLPVLNRVVTVPVFAPNGTLQTEPGYHPAARVYYDPPAGLAIPAVPDYPTKADTDRARLLLFDLVSEFPFVSESERAHALSLAFLPFVRDMIDGPTPLHMVEAAKPGTGKGLLVTVLTSLFTGGSGADETPLSGNEEEIRKKLFALLSEGVPFIYFDNVNQRIDSESLASVLTSDIYRDRKLGVSETVYVPVRCAWVASSNNPVMSNEIARRALRCRLVVDVEFPHLRTDWKHPDLTRFVRDNYGKLVWSILTLARAWVSAGRPAGKRSLGSYESYSKVMGGILSTAGVPGFLDNQTDFYAEVDDEGAALRSFVSGWWDRFGPERQTATALLPVADQAGITFQAWQEDKRKAELGSLLRRQIDNVYGGFAIRKAPAPRGSNSAYRLEAREGQEWTPPAPDDAVTELPGLPPGGTAGGYRGLQGVSRFVPENNREGGVVGQEESGEPL